MNASKDATARIAIIGAGPAGLSVAHFLRKKGYSRTTIFEQNAQAGGKCISLTVDGKSFDLGANYVTGSYTIVQELARKLGADLYTEGGVKSYDIRTKKFRSVFRAVIGESSFFSVAWQSLKYIWKRWRLNSIISSDHPGYRNIAAHPELCQPFEGWLEQNGLKDLTPLFEAPVTLMGYGRLTRTPAAYVLTYLPVTTFLELIGASVSTSILGYPKRFTEGFQRFLERLSWTFDSDAIKLNTRVTGIRRGQHIVVEYALVSNSAAETKGRMEFDYLFMCVPLYMGALSPILTDMSEAEKKLFRQVTYDPFVITTYKMPHCEVFTAGVFMLPEPKMGKPFVVNRQFADCDYITLYTRSPVGEPVDKDAILEANKTFIKECLDLDLCDPFTYNEFVYFPHVTTEAMASGFYDHLEDLQGQNNTFFAGGLMNFELVETIMNYSKHLIDKNFPKVSK
jgi:predicted NAD/FAD-binding protein